MTFENCMLSMNICCFLIMFIGLEIIFIFYIVPYLKKKNEIREQEVKNKKYELLGNIDPDNITKNLNDYFESYVLRYMTYKFVANKVNYIKKEDIEEMVNDLTKIITIDMSDLYLYYIKMVKNINTDEDLISFVHSQISNMTIEHVSSYNKSNDLK